MTRRKNQSAGPIYYTTHQVAQFLGVSLPTVVNWVNSERLRAHRTPGGHRRIAHNDIIAFARAHDYPLSQELLSLTGGPPRILVVDDEADFSEMVREYLLAKGDFEVEVAGSGFQAGFAIARSKPDLVLLDLQMPDLDGLEVCRILRDEPQTRHALVLACTALRGPSPDPNAESPFDGFLEKPLKLDALLSVIQQRLGLEA